MASNEEEIERIRGLPRGASHGTISWGSRFHWLDGDWKRLVDDLETQAALECIKQQSSDDEAIRYIEDARYVAWEIYSSLNRAGTTLRRGDKIEPPPADASEQDYLTWQSHLSSVWAHRHLWLDTMDRRISDKAPQLRADEISYAIGAYLTPPHFRVAYAEHWLLDALIYCQILDFLRENGEALRDRGVSLTRLCASILFVGVLPVVAIYQLYKDHDSTAEFWTFVYYVIVVCPILFWEGPLGLVKPRWKESAASSEIFSSMQSAYRLFGEDCASVSPRRLWQTLDSAEKIGASWDPAAWSMLERITTYANGRENPRPQSRILVE